MDKTLTKVIKSAGGGKHCLLVAGATLAILTPFQAAQASVIFSQAADFPSGNVLASQNDTNSFGNFATVYDNFSFSSDNLVDGVDWVGGYFNGSPAAISSFALSIFGNNAGQPGSLLFSETITGNAGETFIGTDNNGFPVYSYSANLTNTFLAQAGATYWLAIVPSLGFPPQWGWYTSSQGDGVSYQDFLGSRSQLDTDFAFSLTGERVPEPSAILGLLGLGLLGIGSQFKQKR
ncbi:PEP-CTERM sorting domain-containing protein [Microcystis sp. LEGE 08355]|uniref:PEP-CTERM sorting domain-containing protein n=1 Tax=Microcystis sp. LEGE 08355 TaxID=1828687 RepID=UPI001D149627|nr:PEP-CTERM sorting domain-containing protein [Microcystis sp. LEGE 08355]